MVIGGPPVSQQQVSPDVAQNALAVLRDSRRTTFVNPLNGLLYVIKSTESGKLVEPVDKEAYKEYVRNRVLPAQSGGMVGKKSAPPLPPPGINPPPPTGGTASGAPLAGNNMNFPNIAPKIDVKAVGGHPPLQKDAQGHWIYPKAPTAAVSMLPPPMSIMGAKDAPVGLLRDPKGVLAATPIASNAGPGKATSVGNGQPSSGILPLFKTEQDRLDWEALQLKEYVAGSPEGREKARLAWGMTEQQVNDLVLQRGVEPQRSKEPLPAKPPHEVQQQPQAAALPVADPGSGCEVEEEEDDDDVLIRLPGPTRRKKGKGSKLHERQKGETPPAKKPGGGGMKKEPTSESPGKGMKKEMVPRVLFGKESGDTRPGGGAPCQESRPRARRDPATS